MDIINLIEEKLDINIKDPKLVEMAFYHTSYVNENKKINKNILLESNERLEYLGDAILELIVSDFLYHTYPNEPEGFLSRTRSKLVQEESLAKLALEMKFDQFIQLGKGERHNGGQYRFSILSDSFEAFLGALYLDQGMEIVKKFLDNMLLSRHEEILESINKDYKTLLQENLQSKGSVLIEYKLEEKAGPDHNQVFTMGLYVDNVYITSGQGKSKKQAETEAAKKAYIELFSQIIN